MELEFTTIIGVIMVFINKEIISKLIFTIMIKMDIKIFEGLLRVGRL